MSHFGQAPLAAHLPLFAGRNLADIADKAVARDNLEVLSEEEVLLHSVPLGTILSFWGSTAPAGFLPCFGQTVNSSSYPELVEFLNPGQSFATLPDLRGEFLRGWDAGRGVDQGRQIKTAQRGSVTVNDPTASSPSVVGIIGKNEYVSSTFASEAGYDVVSETYYPNVLRASQSISGSASTLQSPNSGFGVTRPRNVSILLCIKAYGSFTNVGTANLGAVLSELSATVKATEFGRSFDSNGFQKLPSGLILQWGTSNTSGREGSSAYNMDTLFPIAFPTSCLSVVASVGANHTDFETVSARDCLQAVNVSAPSRTGFELQLTVQNALSAGRRVQWIALGF